MKFKSFPVILLCVLSLFACKDDEKETTVANSSITQAGVLSGTIVSTNLPANGTVVCLDANSSAEIGTAKVGSDGKFSCTLKALPDGSLETLEMDEGITISDKNVKGGSFSPIFRASGTESYLVKTNLSLENLSDINDLTEISASAFMYVNKDVTVSGNVSDDDGNVVMDMKLKKGWNEVVGVMNVNLSTGKVTAKYTTTIPSGMKWYISSEDTGIFNAPSKVKSPFKNDLFKLLFK